MMLDSVLISTHSCPVFPVTCFEENIFLLHIFASIVKDNGHMNLSLDFIFCSIGLYFYVCASFILLFDIFVV